MTAVAREEGRGERCPGDHARGARWTGYQARGELLYTAEHAKKTAGQVDHVVVDEI